jgi:hypothetical protein
MGYRANGMHLTIGQLAACIRLNVEVLGVDSLLVIDGIAVATNAPRSGAPIKIVGKIILRHSNLSTTQRYLGTTTDNFSYDNMTAAIVEISPKD